MAMSSELVEKLKVMSREMADQDRERQKTCRHEGWSWEKNGRCCFECGAFVVDFGD
jgi:hypothetical protein